MNNPKSVLILWNHATSYLFSAISMLINSDYEVDLVSLPYSLQYPEIQHEVRNNSKFSHFFNLSKLTRDDHRYSAILVCGWRNKKYREYLKSRNDLRVLYFDNHYTGSLKQRIFTLFSRFLLPMYYDKVFVPGSKQANYAQKLGFSRDKIHTGALTYDAETFKIGETRNFHGDFIFVGRIAREKGLETLISAYNRVKPQLVSNRKLLICGPQEDKYLLEMVKKCDYLGYKNAQELSEILSSSYCFVMPSTFEPWGMAVIEAAACGLPVILSSEVGCGSDIFIDNLTPLFEPENEIDLANLLLEADSWSEAEWCSRRNASLEAVSKVHPKEWISKFEKILYVN